MTERKAGVVDRSARTFRIGPSMMHWDDGTLVIEIAERGAPLPYAVHGQIRLTPVLTPASAFALDPPGRHWWQPVAPSARISVRFASPRLSWDGAAYHDANWGAEPLETGFTSWTWSRSHDGTGATVLYDAARRDGGVTALACRFDESTVTPIVAPPVHPLPGTLWRVPRPIRSERAPRLVATLEDTPFYVRSIVETGLGGSTRRTFHESLSLARFAATWVRVLLPFRMPRTVF